MRDVIRRDNLKKIKEEKTLRMENNVTVKFIKIILLLKDKMME